MIKQSLKAIVTAICVVTMLSSGLVCNADETSNVMAMANKKISYAAASATVTTTPMNTTTTITTTNIDDTTTDTTSEVTTTVEVTTSIDTTTSTETTTQDTVISQAITDLPTTTLNPSTMIVSDDILFKLPYETRLLSIQAKVDDYLYNNDAETPDEALSIVKEYLKSICIDAEIKSNDILYLFRYATNITDTQNKNIELNKNFYTNLENTIKSATYKNYSSIETYCKNYIKNAFKGGYLSSKEVISLLNSLHSTIMDSLSDWDIDLIEHSNYEFVSNQSLVNKWNVSYSDLKGWIYIDNKYIDYPLMQPTVEDNNYYLQHNWNGSESSRGAIELDYRCSLSGKLDSQDVTENVIIYGHNLSDNTMFSSLANYKNKSYWQEHQYIEISTDDHQRLYQIYAVCSIYGRANGTKFNYWNEKYLSMDEDTFNEHLKLTQENTYYDTGITPSFGQDILTLQTCDTTDGWRIVIFAKRVK
ncbi:MAG: class B sortase [Ruminococcus sp.]|nr:class B sortase [Ruminococcus sp.]